MANNKQRRSRSKPRPARARVDGISRADGWFNVQSGYGDPKRDKRTATKFRADVITEQYAAELWRGNWLAARIIEKPPGESLREGFEINAGDKGLSEKLSARAEELGVKGWLIRARQYERAYGASALYPIINDSQSDLAKPLSEDSIPTIKFSHLLKPSEFVPQTWYESITEDEKFGEPKTYLVQPRMRGGAAPAPFELHESRLIIFPGIRVGRDQVSAQSGAGDSVLNRCIEGMDDLGISFAAAAALLHDFSQGSYGIKGLAQMMAKTNADELIRARIRAIQLSLSSLGIMLMDAEEKFGRVQTPVTGMAELIDRLMLVVCAAAHMPATLLFGRSPAGENATGQSDIQLWYDEVSLERELEIYPRLERFVYLIIRSHDGPTRGREPEEWSCKFNPLWQESEKEQADTRKTIAETDQIYYNMQAADSEEIAKSRWEGDTYSAEMVIDWAAREKLKNQQLRMQKEALQGLRLGPDGKSLPAPAPGDNLRQLPPTPGAPSPAPDLPPDEDVRAAG